MSDFFGETLFPAISKAAPILAGALGGPAAGLAVGLIANLFGADPKNTDDIIHKMTQDPNATVKLKELELQHIQELRTLDSKNYEIEVDDRKNAREMNLKNNEPIVSVLAIMFMIGFFAYIILGQSHAFEFDKSIFHDLLNVGMLILSYYFGSSYGERKQIH